MVDERNLIGSEIVTKQEKDNYCWEKLYLGVERKVEDGHCVQVDLYP